MLPVPAYRVPDQCPTCGALSDDGHIIVRMVAVVQTPWMGPNKTFTKSIFRNPSAYIDSHQIYDVYCSKCRTTIHKGDIDIGSLRVSGDMPATVSVDDTSSGGDENLKKAYRDLRGLYDELRGMYGDLYESYTKSLSKLSELKNSYKDYESQMDTLRRENERLRKQVEEFLDTTLGEEIDL